MMVNAMSSPRCRAKPPDVDAETMNAEPMYEPASTSPMATLPRCSSTTLTTFVRMRKSFVICERTMQTRPMKRSVMTLAIISSTLAGVLSTTPYMSTPRPKR